jgi:hypothetical protein
MLEYVERTCPGVVIFDTLADTIGGDENSGKDMQRVIDACQDVQRISERQTAQILVGHPGKDPTKGIRGHSSLPAALESSIRVSGVPSMRVAKTMGLGFPTGGRVTMYSRKVKEGAKLASLGAEIIAGGESVYVRLDSKARGLGDLDRRMLSALVDGSKARSEWGKTTGHRDRVAERRASLIADEYVADDGGIVSLTDAGEAAL